MNKTIEDILSRRSVRNFKKEQIEETQLSLILEAGKAAPSSMNRQPWYFSVIQDASLLNWLAQKNREIVSASQELSQINKWINVPNYNNFYHAPTVILISGDTENIWHICDCALAMENMALAAHSIGVDSCIVVSSRFVFQSEEAPAIKEKLAIPQGYAPLYALCLGYNAAENPAPTPRKEDFVHYIR